MKGSCQAWPIVNGEPSRAYIELSKMGGMERPILNYVYANYALAGVKDAMDNVLDSNGKPKYKRNKQGEHYGKDIYEFLQIPKYLSEVSNHNLNELARNFGAKDAYYHDIMFDDATQALEIAQRINSQDTGAVAKVSKHDNQFFVTVEGRSTENIAVPVIVEQQAAKWEVLKEKFNSLNLDITSPLLDKNIVNPVSTVSFVDWLRNKQSLAPNYYINLRASDIKMLFGLNPNNAKVERLKQRLGIDDLGDLAQAVFNALHGGSVTADTLTFIKGTITELKQPVGLKPNDLNVLERDLRAAENNPTITNSKDNQILEVWKDIQNKFPSIATQQIHLGQEIKSMRDAATAALMTLKTKKDELVAKYGVTPESKAINDEMKILDKEISKNEYASGVANFLFRAIGDLNTSFEKIRNMRSTNLTMEDSVTLSSMLHETKMLKDKYNMIAQALVTGNLPGFSEINSADRDRIIQLAKDVIDLMREYEDILKMSSDNTMEFLLTSILGDKLENGAPIATLIQQMDHDSSVWDWLYSWGRQSNPVIAAMGTIVREAQNERDSQLANIALRIRKEQNKLRRSGNGSTRFMYDENGYIISDIDWKKYNAEKHQAYEAFKAAGYRGLSLKEALEEWEDAHTEDRLVDSINDRYERVPNSNYRKAFPQLTQAQKTYYDNMMQIKGELGTLLPTYAQKQFLPPQIRRSFVDAIGQAFREKHTLKKLLKALRVKLQNTWTVREDDTMFYQAGIINGEEFGIMESNIDDTELKKIPIYYLNKIQDKEELLKDFSGALQHFASSAINYAAMNKVRDTVEFMAEYMKNSDPSAKRGSLSLKDVYNSNLISVIKDLRKKSDVLTPGLIDGFIDQHIYGKQLMHAPSWKTKLALSLLGMTSKRHLTVNLKGAISNEIVGELQMLIESGACEFYNPADLVWAHGMLLGTGIKNSYGALMDYATNNESTMPVVLAKRFNPKNDMFSIMGRGRFHTNFIRHLISTDLSFIGYGIGEDIIHNINMYAVLKHTKVNLNGKKVSLYSVLGKTDKEDGNSVLTWDPNATYTNEQGQQVPIDDAFLDKIRDRIRYVNQNTHGSMNTEDKGLIHRHIAGRFIMNLRQWMVEHYSRRYRKRHWDYTLKTYREGFWRTENRYIKDRFLRHGGAGIVNFLREAIGREVIDFESRVAMKWSTMTDEEKANVNRARTEMVVLALLLTLSHFLGAPSDHKKEYFRRMSIYQTARAITDVLGSTPFGLPFELTTLINSPMSATSTVTGLLYPFYGFLDLFEEVKSGRHKGENLYWWKFRRYTLPYYYMIEQACFMGEDDSVFNFDRSIL